MTEVSTIFLFFLTFSRLLLLRTKKTDMSVAGVPPTKKAQPSRKGKKAWRKNVDTTDVEEQLHELRNEERLGYVLRLLSFGDTH